MNESSASSPERIDALLALAPVIPVIAIDDLAQAVPLARTLVEAGLPVLEITLRSPVALAAIEAIAREVPEAEVGAGTVLAPAQFTEVERAGGRFAISPGATDELLAAGREARIGFLPGIATASELMRGITHGYRRFKFFPAAASGGTAALKGFAGPFAEVRFCPTGGIDAASAPAYLALPNVACVGGSWMLPTDALKAGDWARIGQLAREAAALGR